jgi:tetratricopeptide (TPR) repeat protein
LLLTVLAWAEIPPSERLMHAGRVTEAADAARQEVQAAPTDLAAWERYLDALSALGRTKEAVEIAKGEVRARPTDPDAQYLLGRAYPTAKEAQAAYEAALRLAPTHARANMGMGAIHRSRSAHAEAEAAYRRALAVDPSLGEAWAGLAAALVAQQRVPEALDAGRKAMVALPDEAEGYLTVALLSPKEALLVLQEARKRMPYDARIHERLGELMLAAGEGAAAMSEAKAALAIDPTRFDARMIASYAFDMARGSIDPAGYHELVALRQKLREAPADTEAKLSSVVQRYPDAVVARVARAEAHGLQGDAAGMAADLEVARKLDPASADVAAAYGLVLADLGRPAEARAPLAQALSARPGDRGLTLALAKAELASGDTPGARDRLARLNASRPTDVEVILAYAGALAASKDSDGAYRFLSGAVRKVSDARVVLALAAAARDIGKFDEAASLVDELARQSGEERLHAVAEQLRAQGAAAAAAP